MFACVIIDTLGLDDLPELHEIEKELYPNESWTKDNLQIEFFKNNSIILGIRENNKLVAYSFSSFILSEIHLLNIGVKKEKQGQGYSKIILKKLIKIAKLKKSEIIFLEVNVNNIKAINLYKKFNFIINNIRKNYYENNEDAYLMSLKLEYE